MKKIFSSLAVLMMLLLMACSEANQISASKSMADSLCGTYAGKNGSALTLFPDGTSEYYYMLYPSTDIDKGAGKWNYEDGILTWMYNDHPVTATINEQSAFSFTLEQSTGWNREQFIKASDSTESKTAEQYRKILRDTLNRPEMDNFDSGLNKNYTISGLTISIPFYWNKAATENGDLSFFSEKIDSEKCYTELAVFPLGVQCSNDQFDLIASDLWNGMKESYKDAETIVEPALTKIGNLKVLEGCFKGINEGEPINFNVALVNNPETDLIVIVQAVTDNTIFCYNSDFKRIVHSITAVADGSPEVDSERVESSQAASSFVNNGVTPELKAFLDSYETYIDQYILFMQKYESSDDTYSMLSDYLEMMQTYTDFAEKLDQYDTDKMSAADSAYYLEVTTRVAKKLYSAANQ